MGDSLDWDKWCLSFIFVWWHFQISSKLFRNLKPFKNKEQKIRGSSSANPYQLNWNSHCFKQHFLRLLLLLLWFSSGFQDLFFEHFQNEKQNTKWCAMESSHQQYTNTQFPKRNWTETTATCSNEPNAVKTTLDKTWHYPNESKQIRGLPHSADWEEG